MQACDANMGDVGHTDLLFWFYRLFIDMMRVMGPSPPWLSHVKTAFWQAAITDACLSLRLGRQPSRPSSTWGQRQHILNPVRRLSYRRIEANCISTSEPLTPFVLVTNEGADTLHASKVLECHKVQHIPAKDNYSKI